MSTVRPPLAANLGHLQLVALCRACLFGVVVATPVLAGMLAQALASGTVP